MKKLAMSAFALLCAAGTAYADPISLPAATPLFITFNNIEQVQATNNLVVPGYAPAAAYLDGLQGNWGLFNVTSIQNGFALPVPDHNDIAGGANFFSNDGVGGSVGQITGIFYGVDFTSATTATNGRLDLYWHNVGQDTIDNSCLGGVGCLPDAAAVARFTTGNGGILLASLDFASGIIPGNDMTFLSSSTDPSTQGGSGHADAFANVRTGAGLDSLPWTSILNGNWFHVDGSDGNVTRGDGPTEIRDLRFSTFFNADLTTWNDFSPVGCINPTTGLPTGASCIVGLRSNDPARVLTADVPEPATLGLLGVGLLGLVARARRRKAE